MTPKDLSIIVRGVAPVIREYVAASVGGWVDRLTAIEQRMASVKDGRDGRDGVCIQGDRGERGADGIGIAGVAVSESRLSVTLTNGVVLDAGEVRGEKGIDGRDGTSFSIGQGSPTKSADVGDSYLDISTGKVYVWR